jgi:hypothetical protein
VSERLDDAARRYEEIAAELERATAHAKVVAEHLREENVPRASAHAWAVRGHLLEAQSRLDDQAREHARRSEPHAV